MDVLHTIYGLSRVMASLSPDRSESDETKISIHRFPLLATMPKPKHQNIHQRNECTTLKLT